MPDNNQNFKNPYLGLPKDQTKQVVSIISLKDYRLLRCMRPELSTLTGTINTLILKLCNELRKRNITDVDNVQQFEQFVANCVITDGATSADNITISRADYEQLCIDSREVQLAKVRPNSGGLRDRATRRSPAKRKTTDRTGETGTCDPTAEHAPIVPDLQSGSGEARSVEGSETAEGGQNSK